MKKRNKFIFKTLIVGIFLCLVIGFAVLTSNLDINGSFLFSSNKWDIHVENVFVDSNSTVSDVPKIDNTKNSISFTATLSKPTDNYTFYVDIVNDSTVDAMFNSMSITGLEDVTDYVTSTVTYENGTSLNQNDILYKDFSTCLKVSIVYKDITIEQIPRENITVTATMTFNYKQANGDAKLVAGTNQVNFDFSGTEDTYVVPYNGVYQLEVWGAQGGTVSFNNQIIDGGYGGYSVGSIHLNKDQNVYINVGGSGTTCKNDVEESVGGYNGGGKCTYYSSTYYTEYGTGGGATHIALEKGLLSSLESKTSNILIVAGGGGGSGVSNFADGTDFRAGIGGSGGGESGTASINISKTFDDAWISFTAATGGSQTSGGIPVSRFLTDSNTYSTYVVGDAGLFGQGGGISTTNSSGACDGGGGYYGGSGNRMIGGTGGSGYIGNDLLTDKIMYCYNCTESENAKSKTKSTNNLSSGPISKSAKMGNGYARIGIISLEK